MGQPWFRIRLPPQIALGLAALFLASWTPKTVKNTLTSTCLVDLGSNGSGLVSFGKQLLLFLFHVSPAPHGVFSSGTHCKLLLLRLRNICF